ncbi:zinc finger CCCH domain-containing protein 35-like [Curcuma longa]|uniref:zinc finger CCCH domain-containing protein 35-like n=1 Tax=Curcuma longa TaxID=136217 RepID=UPI003D9EBB89
MMMIGRDVSHQNPTVHVPPWSSDDPAAGYELLDDAALAALQLYFREEAGEYSSPVVDAYSSDDFRMYEFKVRRCGRARAHDWTECPFAHPGEKARRRDPRKQRYSGAPCPDFRKAGGCKRGDSCELAHGVFECWLHPGRYRTQPCKDGTACRRRVCFFAHTPDQLRLVPPQTHQQSSPSASAAESNFLQNYLVNTLASSPTSTMTSPPMSRSTDSPPISPSGGKLLRRASFQAGPSVNDIVASLRLLQLAKTNSAPSSWPSQVQSGEFSSPTRFNTGFCSTPSTPTASAMMRAGAARWLEEEEPPKRVNSGRPLRAKMFERLSKECISEMADEYPPDVEWVSELLR